MRILIMRPSEMAPPMRGETNQLATIEPILPQLTTSTPIPAAPKPTMAPTMVWVVETGQPRLVAIISQMAAASNAASMP